MPALFTLRFIQCAVLSVYQILRVYMSFNELSIGEIIEKLCVIELDPFPK